MKIDILSLTFGELEDKIVEVGEPKFRAKQIFEWLHGKNTASFSQMTNISAQLQAKLETIFCINSPFIKKKLVSSIDDTLKYLYMLNDEEQVETVLMRYKHGNSLCISTQVGCRMGCKFCASAIAGFVRNLEPSEMLTQIYATERDSNVHVDSIVLMGIGEPLDNFDNVVKFLEILSDKNGRNMSLRHISLSTCGLVDKIDLLAQKRLGLTLSVSLHAANDEKRSEIMPINKRYNLKELIRSCDNYFMKTGRRISFEYALIEDVNDDRASANELIQLISHMSAHVNIIPVNPVKETEYRRSNYLKDFQKMLCDGGINATVRRTLGRDIEAACGQLRRDSQ